MQKTEQDILKELLETELGIEPEEQDIANLPAPIEFNEIESRPDNRTEDVHDDYKEIRRVLYNQIQMMDEASKVALLNLMSGDSPRYMEVFSQLMTTMGNTAEKLLKVQKQMKELDAAGQGQGSTTINAQNVFYGTPNDLLAEEGNADEQVIEGERIE